MSARDLFRHLYRLVVLFAFPPGFRRRHGEEMVQVFSDLLDDVRARHGKRAAVACLCRSIVDAFSAAPSAWTHALRRTLAAAPAPGEARSSGSLGGAWDLGYALRGLQRQKAHTSACLLTLALGIGAYPYEIVGVVNDVRFASVKALPRPELFIPHAQNPYLDLTVVVRGRGEAASLVALVREEIAAVDPRQPAHAVATMEDLVRRSTAADRFLAALVLGLAGLALVLAATGLYGLLAYLVGQRTAELGLRMALGATPRRVIGLVLRESLRLVFAGSVLGLGLALGLLPQVAHLLYEVGPLDRVAWLAGTGLLLVTALGASLVPARAAGRVDPLAALRAE